MEPGRPALRRPGRRCPSPSPNRSPAPGCSPRGIPGSRRRRGERAGAETQRPSAATVARTGSSPWRTRGKRRPAQIADSRTASAFAPCRAPPQATVKARNTSAICSTTSPSTVPARPTAPGVRVLKSDHEQGDRGQRDKSQSAEAVDHDPHVALVVVAGGHHPAVLDLVDDEEEAQGDAGRLDGHAERDEVGQDPIGGSHDASRSFRQCARR